jgi:hypothetical protein
MRNAQFACLFACLAAIPLALLPAENVWAAAGRPTKGRAAAGNDLFVTADQFCVNPSVGLLNPKTYKQVGTITNGIICPYGVTLDAKGNLYVADLGYTPTGVDIDSGDIVIYAPGATTPTTTLLHGAGLVSATGLVSVTTDKHGNVYGGTSINYGQQNGGESIPSVVMWPAGNPEPHVVCPGPSQRANIDSVAVDSKGNVVYASDKQVAECAPSGVQHVLNGVGGEAVAIDTHDNLLSSISGSGTIGVSAPPYLSVTRTIGAGLMTPTDIKLNAKNTQVYVADHGLGQFITIDYQTGAVVSSVAIPGIQSAVKPPNAINK